VENFVQNRENLGYFSLDLCADCQLTKTLGYGIIDISARQGNEMDVAAPSKKSRHPQKNESACLKKGGGIL